MFVAIINDCSDENAFGRQVARASVLFGANIVTVGVKFGYTLEGAGNLIDLLDSLEGSKGIIMVNLAPRHGEGKKWENGSPFCYFNYQNALVASTVDGLTLSLVKKLKLTSEVKLLDVTKVIRYSESKGLIDRKKGERIISSQFRSFDFLPRAAKWISEGMDVPYVTYAISKIDEAPKAVWLVDNFGNCKTTLLPKDVDFEPGTILTTKIGDLKCYRRLKDVPINEPGIVIGSSGLNEDRFLEVVVKGKSAAEKFNLGVGSVLF
jgi:hypothetical protein